MSDIHGLIPHQVGYYYISLEEDYVALFETHARQKFEMSAKTEEDERKRDTRIAHAVAKAYISSVLEHLSDTIYKTTGSEEDLWVFLSFPELELRLHGAYKMRTLKDAMKELIEDGYISKRPNRDPRFKALEYQMNLEQYRSGLDALPKKTKKNNAKMHSLQTDGAKMHEDSAKMHEDSAKMHEQECKNAPKKSAKMHPRSNSREVTERENKERTKREAATPHEETEMATLAAVLSLLKKLPEDQIQQVLTLLQKPGTSGETPATGSASQPVSGIVEIEAPQAEDLLPQKPEPSDPRSADMVVALVEFLRGQRYSAQDRSRESRAGFKLLNQFPELSLGEIEEAWLHGSDAYWRNTHGGDNVHVHDLINKDSHGKHRVLAFLEHKRAQERRGQPSPVSEPKGSISRLPTERGKPVMSEVHAKTLVTRISQDAERHGCDGLHGELQPQDTGWIVRVSWTSSAWRGDLGLEIGSLGQWEKEFGEWQEVIQFREARKRKEA